MAETPTEVERNDKSLKEKTTKAERRALQETQRAAKASGKGFNHLPFSVRKATTIHYLHIEEQDGSKAFKVSFLSDKTLVNRFFLIKFRFHLGLTCLSHKFVSFVRCLHRIPN